MNLNLLRVDAWWTDLGGIFQYGGMTAGGVATTTVRIKVALSMEMIGESVVLEQTVNVRPRIWKLRTQTVQVGPAHSEHRYLWGWYAWNHTLREKMRVKAGTGPWAGTDMLDGHPSIDAIGLYMHSDLVEEGESYKLVHETCGMQSGLYYNVYSLNHICATDHLLDDWREKVVAHEERHRDSLNDCIVRVDPKLRGWEATVGPEGDVVAARDAWEKAAKALMEAARTKQDKVKSQAFWEWRYHQKWTEHPLEHPGHNGKNGCPEI